MRVPTSKEIANHTEPESWGASREGGAQALTGEDAGQPLSLEKDKFWGAAPLRIRVGEVGCRDNASGNRAPRGRRTCTRIETTYTETGRSHERPRRDSIWVRAENPQGEMRR